MKKAVFYISVMLFSTVMIVPAEALALDQDDCTRDGPRSTPSGEFTVLDDSSIVRHERTGLEWQRCSIGQTWDPWAVRCEGRGTWLRWDEAMEKAEAIEGWRLPTLDELRSIVERCRTRPAINRAVFPNTRAAGMGSFDYFWTSTRDSNQAKGIGFSDGRVISNARANQFGVRLVREGQ